MKKLCLLQPEIEIPVEEMDARRDELAETLAWLFRADGYRVMPARELIQHQESRAREQGGWFDSDTGAVLPDRRRAIEESTYRYLREEIGCDALVHSRVMQVTAEWADGTARWDGVRRDIGGGLGLVGTVDALSVAISIHDMQDRELYFHTGGVQVLARLVLPLLGRSHFDPIEPGEILADREEVGEALRAALSPMWPR